MASEKRVKVIRAKSAKWRGPGSRIKSLGPTQSSESILLSVSPRVTRRKSFNPKSAWEGELCRDEQNEKIDYTSLIQHRKNILNHNGSCLSDRTHKGGIQTASLDHFQSEFDLPGEIGRKLTNDNGIMHKVVTKSIGRYQDNLSPDCYRNPLEDPETLISLDSNNYLESNEQFAKREELDTYTPSNRNDKVRHTSPNRLSISKLNHRPRSPQQKNDNSLQFKHHVNQQIELHPDFKCSKTINNHGYSDYKRYNYSQSQCSSHNNSFVSSSKRPMSPLKSTKEPIPRHSNSMCSTHMINTGSEMTQVNYNEQLIQTTVKDVETQTSDTVKSALKGLAASNVLRSRQNTQYSHEISVTPRKPVQRSQHNSLPIVPLSELNTYHSYTKHTDKFKVGAHLQYILQKADLAKERHNKVSAIHVKIPSENEDLETEKEEKSTVPVLRLTVAKLSNQNSKIDNVVERTTLTKSSAHSKDDSKTLKTQNVQHVVTIPSNAYDQQANKSSQDDMNKELKSLSHSVTDAKQVYCDQNSSNNNIDFLGVSQDRNRSNSPRRNLGTAIVAIHEDIERSSVIKPSYIDVMASKCDDTKDTPEYSTEELVVEKSEDCKSNKVEEKEDKKHDLSKMDDKDVTAVIKTYCLKHTKEEVDNNDVTIDKRFHLGMSKPLPGKKKTEKTVKIAIITTPTTVIKKDCDEKSLKETSKDTDNEEKNNRKKRKHKRKHSKRVHVAPDENDVDVVDTVYHRTRRRSSVKECVDVFDDSRVKVDYSMLVEYLTMVKENNEEYLKMKACASSKKPVRTMVGMANAYRRGHHELGPRESIVVQAAYELGSKIPHPVCVRYEKMERQRAEMVARASLSMQRNVNKRHHTDASEMMAIADHHNIPDEHHFTNMERCRAEVELWLRSLSTAQQIKAKELALKAMGEEGHSIRKWWLSHKYCKYLRQKTRPEEKFPRK